MPTKQTEAVEAISSYAHRVGDRIHLVLHLPRTRSDRDSARLVFSTPDRQFETQVSVAPAEPGVLLETSVTARELRRGVWNLGLQLDEDGPLSTIQARLLTSPRQPIALLPGPTPETRMRPPRPRPAREDFPLSALGGVRRRLARIAPERVKSVVRHRSGS